MRTAILRNVVAVAVASGAAALLYLPRPASADTPAYVGASKCMACHMAQHKSWKATKMGQAFELLKPGAAADKKAAAKLDPAKDYTTDAVCLACHTTGFGAPGGYKVGDAEAAKREGVMCEACHGPGSLYVPVMKEIMASKRNYKTEELAVLGLVLPNADNCKKCHNDKSPFVKPGAAFDFEKMKTQGTHEHKPLNLRIN